MKLLGRDWLREMVFCFFMWAILVLFQGYQIGTGENNEFLPYTIYLTEESILPNDLFIQSMEAAGVNEHMVISRLLAFFYPYQETTFLILHILSTVVLVLGMLRLCSRFIKNTYFRYVIVLLTLLLSYHINLGGDELWHNSLQGASIAKAMGIWAINFVLDDRVIKSTILTIAATLFAPLIGLHLFLLFGPVFLYQAYVSQRIPVFEAVLSAFFYILSAGAFIWAINFSQGEEVLATISNEEFANLVFNFRYAHQYHPLFFSRQGIVLMLFLIPIALVFFQTKDQRLSTFLASIIIGVFIYLGALYQENNLIISSWWFRTMIWAKFLGFIAVGGLIEKHFVKIRFRENKNMEVLVLGTACFLAGVAFSIFQESLPGNKPYHFSASNLYNNPETDIALQVRKNTPKDAVFLHPLEFTALKYYGKRSSYVDFQAIPKRRDFLPTWSARLEEVYGINTELKEKGLQLKKPAYAGLVSLNEEKLIELKTKGVTHLLTFKEHQLHLKIVAGNNVYKVYEL